MFFPWSEIKTLRYFKDKKCNMNAAFQLLKIGDIDAATQQSIANLESCKSDPSIKPKILGKAYYNVGVSYFMRDDHDEALKYLQKAFEHRNGKLPQTAHTSGDLDHVSSESCVPSE